MRLLSWNVNGLRAVQKRGFLDWFLSDAPEALCLQETKASPDQLDDELIEVPGYHVYFDSHKFKKGYSGVALYSKAEPISVEYGIGIDLYDTEGRMIIAEYPSFILCNVYFPNGKMEGRLSYKLDFYEEFLAYCDERREDGHSIIICGDFNTAHHPIDLKHPKANEEISGFLPIEREWMDKLEDHGYVDAYRHLYPERVQYSWWSYMRRARERDSGWRLDYHYVTEDLLPRVKDAKILTDVMGSDHCPVELDLD